MNKNEISNSWLGRLLFRHPYSALILHNKGLQVSDGSKKLLLPFSRLHSVVQVRRRFFWSHLAIKTAKNLISIKDSPRQNFDPFRLL